jgi:hypothetical protein
MGTIPSRYDRMRIAVEGRCDLRSVGGAYAGRPLRPMTLLRVVDAARKLGLPLPPTTNPAEQRAAS